MKIGVVKEILDNEFRVGLSASSVLELVNLGHEVIVEEDAGINANITNDDYIKAGAKIVSSANLVWENVNLIVKVKEPQEAEFKYFKEDLIIFSFLHLSAHKDLSDAIINAKATAIAYETVKSSNNQLPILKPMSQIAGRMAAIIGSNYLGKNNGGSGVLISGLPGVKSANAVVVGAGNVGINALDMLVGLNANVTILDVDINKLETLESKYGNKVKTLYSSDDNLEEAISNADLVIGAISLPGAKTPKLIKTKYYHKMNKGSVIIDVAIDQGGASEASRPTTHDNPIYFVDGIMHYCVPNIPGAVPVTATIALNNAVLGFVKLIANKGLKTAYSENLELKNGINILNGKVVNKAVASAHNYNLIEM